MKISVNYITRPWFFDISVEFIQELKQQVNLNVILIIAPATVGYLGLTTQEAKQYLNKTLKLEDVLKGDNYTRLYHYFEGANVFCKFEEHKESNYKNALAWFKLLKNQPHLFKAELNIIESLSLADWYYLLRFRNKKLFYIIHDPVPHTGEERSRVALTAKYYFPYINKFITYSNFSAALFKKHYPAFEQQLLTFKMPVYSSLNINKTDNLGKQNRKKVVFFGRISPYKGVELFYQAAAQLSTQNLDTDFIIAGKTIEDYHPEFLIHNPHSNIIIKNKFIDLNELFELMNGAEFCVLPYLDATQSGVIMTAYAFNLPVLVSDCPGLLEYCFNPEHFSFANGDLESLKTKMDKLLKQPNLLIQNKAQIASYTLQNVSAANAALVINEIANPK